MKAIPKHPKDILAANVVEGRTKFPHTMRIKRSVVESETLDTKHKKKAVRA